jgi:hypothetical protein
MGKTEQHSITPPPELRCQWQSESPFKVISVEREDHMIDRAARWGADQELEACCEWLDSQSLHLDGSYLRTARRPKPPSLKEQAITKLQTIRDSPYPCNYQEDSDWDTILIALEALPND